MKNTSMNQGTIFASGLLVGVALALGVPYVHMSAAGQVPEFQQLVETMNRHEQKLNQHDQALDIMGQVFGRIGINMQTDTSTIPDIIQLSRKVDCLSVGGTVDAYGNCSK